MASQVSLAGEGVSLISGDVSLPGHGVSQSGRVSVHEVGASLGGSDAAPATLNITSIPGTGFTSSTIHVSGVYATFAPASVTGQWNAGAIASVVTAFTASALTWSATFSTPGVEGTYTLTVTGTGANLGSDTSGDVVLSGAPAYVGPLDVVGGAVLAYSQRAMAAAWVSDAITLRRSSDDTTASFATTASNAVDPAAVSAFIGGGSGFATKWFDQSGHTFDGVQGTAAAQPLWAAAVLGAAPGFTFDGVGQFLATSASSLPNGAYTWFAVANTNPEFDGGRVLGINNAGGSDVNGPDWVAGISSTQVRGFADGAGFVNGNGEAFAPATATTAFTIIDAGWNASGGTAFQNGAALSGTGDNIYGDGTVGAITFPIGIGTDDAITPSSFYQGGVVEILVYPTLLSSGDRLALRQNIAAYYGISL